MKRIMIIFVVSLFLLSGCFSPYMVVQKTTTKYPDGKVVVREKSVPANNAYVGYLYNSPSYYSRRSQFSMYPYYSSSFNGYPVRRNNSGTIWSTGGSNCRSSSTSGSSSRSSTRRSSGGRGR